MIEANFYPYKLQFTEPILTSRSSMSEKRGYFLLLSLRGRTGIGECSFIEDLSIDDLSRYEPMLKLLCNSINKNGVTKLPNLTGFPSIEFGIECAIKDLQNGGSRVLFPSDFTKGKTGIPINGLIWMGNEEKMLRQINAKLKDGFRCIKIKVGAIEFDHEVKLIKSIREKYSSNEIEIRLDANGAFTSNDVFPKLNELSKFQIHSIEQPVRSGQYELMSEVCAKSSIAVALDEELIFHYGKNKQDLLEKIKPAYVILKPSMLGGFKQCEEWIEAAKTVEANWWVTSALESNIGLNAIAQWVFSFGNSLVQGLGTGMLYINNIESPLEISSGQLFYDQNSSWESNLVEKIPSHL